MTTTPEPTPESAAEHVASLTSMLKGIEWQINRDCGSQWLAGKLYEAGARAGGLLVGDPTEEQPWNDPNDANSPAYASPWEKASAIIKVIRAAQFDLLHDRPLEDVQDEITLSINRLDALCATMLAAGVAPQEPSETIHEPDASRIYCVRCGYDWPCQPAPSPDREKLIAEAFPFDGSDPDAVIECRRRVRDLIAALAAAPVLDEAKLAEAMHLVESVHQIHGTRCLCGFESHRSRSRTEHITSTLAEALRGGGR